MVHILITLLALSVSAEPQAPNKRFLVTGTTLRTTLLTQIYSYNLVTPVIAELDADAQFCDLSAPSVCGPTVFPRKTRFIGHALVTKSHDRVNCEFTLAVLPDGKEIPISGIILSPDGSGGIKGRVQKHKDSMVASAALKGAIVGAASTFSSTTNPIAGSASEELAGEALKEIDLSREQVDTSIEVSAYTRALIYLNQRIEIDATTPASQSKGEEP